jgi:RNA polymerase sigma factor (sigma-70 family)
MTILKVEKVVPRAPSVIAPIRNKSSLSPRELVELARGFLAQSARRKATLYGLDADDLLQESALALLELARYFDPERGSLCTFARFAVKAAVARLIEEQMKRRREVSAARNDDGDALENLAVTHDPADERAGTRLAAEAAAEALEKLPDRLQSVVRSRLGIEGATLETFKAIGAALGISEERARQLYRRAVARLRQGLCAGRAAVESR